MRPVHFAPLALPLATLLATTGSAQKTTGPKATYEMDVETMAAMGMGMGMPGGFGALLGGGGSDYVLGMRLKSASTAPQQPETGDHFFAPAAKMGKSVPLLGNAPGKADDTPEHDYDRPEGKLEKPKGRILMFWGCYAKAPKGQPFIIDFAKMPTAKMPPGMDRQMEKYRGMANARDENAAWWPNSKNGKQPKSGSSLVGEHRVSSNFTPEIKFTLGNDYMAKLKVDTGDDAGGVKLSWNAAPTATGYAAWAMGGMQNAGSGGDMVMWTSANNRDFGEGMGWLSPAEVQKQISLKNVMPPSQTSCSIPAEAKAAAGNMMFGSLNGFGPEDNFAFPPKPADPKAVWNIEWTSKVRFRSFASFMVGNPMDSGAGGSAGGGSGPAAPPKKKKPCKGPFGVPIPGTEC